MTPGIEHYRSMPDKVNHGAGCLFADRAGFHSTSDEIGRSFESVRDHEIFNGLSLMKITQAFALLLVGFSVAQAAEPAPSYYPAGQGVIGLETPLPGQVVPSLSGTRQALLPGQVVKPLPGQIVQALPGQVVGSLSGQMLPSHPRYLRSIRNNP